MEIQGGKFLTLYLHNEEYGIPIQKIKEIIGIMEITDIPRTPDFIKGVINLRGKIIPVMDLRLRLGVEEKEYNQRTCIVVVEISNSESKRQVGIVVDAVSEVVNIQKNEVEGAVQYGACTDDGFLHGIGKLKGRVILLLDIDSIVSGKDFVL